MRRKLDPEYSDAAIMYATGWDWDTLNKTPSRVVEQMTEYLEVQAAYANRKSGDKGDGPATLGSRT